MAHEDGAAYLRVYGDLLEKLYTEEYRHGDKIPTARELCVFYGVSVATVRKTIKRLRDEGLIRTESRNGTIVLFDPEKPEHFRVATPYRPKFDENEMNTLRIPAMLIASISGTCAQNTTAAERAELVSDLNMLLYNLQRGEACGKLTREFFTKLIGLSRNSFLIDISADLTHGFVLFVPPQELGTQAEKRQRSVSVLFFTQLRMLLSSGDCAAVRPAVKAFYEALYRIPNVFYFSPASRGQMNVRQEPLYSKIAQRISRDIVSGRLQQGDVLPSQNELCARFGVGRNTVLRACEILKEHKLIESRYRGGTTVIVDTRSAEFQQVLRAYFRGSVHETMSALTALWAITDSVCAEAMHYITEETLLMLGKNLEEHYLLSKEYDIPLILTDALIMPLVLSLKNSRLSKYYAYMMAPILRFSDLYFLRTRNTNLQTEAIHKAGHTAIKSLRAHDIAGFLSQIKLTAKHNSRLFALLGNERQDDPWEWNFSAEVRRE